MTRLAEMFNVNHFIVSQVNPHVVPFLTKDEKSVGQDPLHSSIITPGPGWLDSLSQIAKGEALHRMRTLAELGVFPNILTKTVSVLSQKYSGDITIFPEISYADFPRMLTNPTPEYMQLAMLSGQRATWPKLSVINNHCAIELALDDAVQKLRTRVVFSDDAVESRVAPRHQKVSTEIHPRAARTPVGGRRVVSRDGPLELSSSKAKTQTSSPRNERGRSNRLNLSLRHKKSLSINTLLVQPDNTTRIPETRPSTADAVAGTSNSFARHQSQTASKNLHDVTSSGADETSNLSHSSSSTSLDFSSPTESPSSPAEPTPKWSRAFFGSSSQPTTPKPALEPLSMSTSNVKSDNQLKPPISTKKPSSSGTSTPEAKYKRLFQRPGQGLSNGSPNSLNKSRPNTPTPDKNSPKSQRKSWGMEIDIPSTAKGMVGKVKGKKVSGSG